jgi:hypothetical protein
MGFDVYTGVGIFIGALISGWRAELRKAKRSNAAHSSSITYHLPDGGGALPTLSRGQQILEFRRRIRPGGRK